ncbi:MAG: FAD-binding oxidoreductase [Aureispira sp.]
MFYPFYIDNIVQESTTIKSFYLKRKDGTILPKYFPGQFVAVQIQSEGKRLSRNYTLSDAPNKDYYRLTIKREALGVVSRYFHDDCKVGSILELSDPMGKFHLDTSSTKPVVLLSGGVGITPMMSMLEFISTASTSQKVHFIHSSLYQTVQPFANRLSVLKQQNSNLTCTIFHTSPLETEEVEKDYDYRGVVNKAILAETLETQSDYFLCGPIPFMEAMYMHLTNLGVSSSAIHYEFFGEEVPLGKTPNFKDSKKQTHKVLFTTSNLEVKWEDNAQSILDLAESKGLTPANSCRMGTCSTCECTLLSGSIAYDPEPFMEAEEGKILLCCAKPTSDIQLEL